MVAAHDLYLPVLHQDLDLVHVLLGDDAHLVRDRVRIRVRARVRVRVRVRS